MDNLERLRHILIMLKDGELVLHPESIRAYGTGKIVDSCVVALEDNKDGEKDRKNTIRNATRRTLT